MAITLIEEPRVTLMGYTVPTVDVYSHGDIHDDDATSVEVLPIFGGRACYQSFGEKAGRRSAAEYLGHIIEVKHFSVLGHSHASFYLEGVSRSLTHELVRHHFLAPSQLSQRYVKIEDDVAVVIPPADLPLTEPRKERWIQNAYLWQSMYQQEVNHYEQRGFTGKGAREAARAVLPNCIETKGLFTGSLWAWAEVLAKRNHPAADYEIQRLAREIQRQLHRLAPHVIKPVEEQE